MTPSMTSTDSAAEPDTLAFGAPLRHAREEKGLSVQAVSDELYIITPYLTALEAEDFSAMPPVVYARGFLVNYARFLELDTKMLASRFDAACPSDYRKPPENISALPIQSNKTRSARRMRFNPWLLLALIALIIGAVALWLLVSSSTDDDKPITTPTVINMDSAEQQAGAALNATGSAIGASGSALGVTSTAPASLDLVVTEDTMVSITDADNNTLVSKRLPAGSYHFEGAPPFAIQIATVDSVTLQMNGSPVDMREYTQDNRADFTLMPE